MKACPELGRRLIGPSLDRARLWQAKYRLAFDDCTVVRKRVKGLYKQIAVACLNVDVADRSHRNSTTRVEGMQHALPPAIVNQLLLETPKNLGVHGFELEADLVTTTAATFDGIRPLAM